MVKIKITDAQVNFGKDVYSSDSNLERYVVEASKANITKAVMIPAGTHNLTLEDGTIEKACIWSEKNGVVIFKKILEKKNKIREEINPENPYLNMNLHVLEVVASFKGPIKFYFCPKVHALLDTVDSLEAIIKNNHTVAIKIHGLASHTTPKDVPDWLINLSKKYDKPFLIHTDYRNSKFKNALRNILGKIVLDNNPLAWAKWAVENEVKAYLAHGLRLDPSAAEIVNENPNLVVGYGPDFALEKEQEALAILNKPYVDTLFHLLKSKKVLFGFDYGYNYKVRGDWNSLDWEGPKRIATYAEKNNLGNEFLKQVLHDNAKRFFKLA